MTWILPSVTPFLARRSISVLAQASPAALLSVARNDTYWDASPSSLESMMMTGMPASLAFFTAGWRAVVSDGASTIALTPRSIALSTMLISSLMLLSDWAPRKVTESFGVLALSSVWAAMAPVCTFCQKLELPVLTMTAISPPPTAVLEPHPGKIMLATRTSITRINRVFFILFISSWIGQKKF